VDTRLWLILVRVTHRCLDAVPSVNGRLGSILGEVVGWCIHVGRHAMV
jgi:hypothetical protein